MESVRPEPYCVGSLQISQFQWLFKCQRWFYYKFKKVMINGETLAHTTTAADKLKIGDYKMLQKWIVFIKNLLHIKIFLDRILCNWSIWVKYQNKLVSFIIGETFLQ